MVRLITLSIAFASASAFAPSTLQTKGSALTAKPVEKEIGVLPPIGFFE
jgi:hypothetical protein